MTKALLGFQIFTTSLIHLLCCGLPILISLSGGLSVLIAFQTFKPALLGMQFMIFGFIFYQLYKPAARGSKTIRNQRIVFWFISFLSISLFFYPPVHWFKSEETRLKQLRMERFFKHKTQ